MALWLLISVTGLTTALAAHGPPAQPTPPAPVTAAVRLATDPLTCTQPTTLLVFLIEHGAYAV